ncbi:MAG: helix-turn-helix domain-containing protein [Actinomycetota bacterium]|nr:helix-turn-helix domain-containing protein [Actinomycetota bacterium]
MVEHDGDSRQRTLDAAAELFAEHGFHGTKVGQIAARAGVSQALIYYNFSSKAEILDELLATFRTDLADAFDQIYTARDDRTHYGRWEPDEIRAGLHFFERNRAVLTTLLVESLKTGERPGGLVKLWDDLNRDVRERLLAERGFELHEGGGERDLVDFFFVFVPALLYAVLGEEWRTVHGYEEKEVDRDFGTILNAVYRRFLEAT